MTRREEKLVFEMLVQIRYEVNRNGTMLDGICDAINTYLANHNRENEDDFMRNVLANLISSGVDIGKLRRR